MPKRICVEHVRIGQQLVVIDLHQERDAVGIFAGHAPSTPNVEATALQPPSMASLTIFSGSKYRGSARSWRRPNARSPGRPARSTYSPCRPIGHGTSAPRCQHALIAITGDEDAVDEVGPGQMQLLLRDRAAAMFEQFRSVRPQQFHNPFTHHNTSGVAAELESAKIAPQEKRLAL